MTRHRSEINPQAPIHWVIREEYTVYFNELSPDERWSNSQYPEKPILWHWDEKRWWAMEEDASGP